MSAVLANALWAAAVAAFLTSGYAAGRRRMRECRLLAALGSGLTAVECVLVGAWFAAAWNAVLVVVLLGWDWWNRKGKRVAKALGGKSRAVLAAVVAKAREAATPLPEGARA